MTTTSVDSARSSGGSRDPLLLRLDRRGGALVALLLLVVPILVMLPLRQYLSVTSIVFVFLICCYAAAVVAGRNVALAYSVVSFLAANFFFVKPYYTLTIASGEQLSILVAFLLVAGTTSQLVAQLRQRTLEIVQERQNLLLLYELNGALIGGATLQETLEAIVTRIVQIYGSQSARILSPDPDGDLRVRADHPHDTTSPDRQSLAMATWAMEHGEPAGRSAHRRKIVRPQSIPSRSPAISDHAADVLYVPILLAGHPLGVIEVTGRPGGGRFDANDQQLLATFAAQAALAIERARLSDEAARAEVLRRSDELKSALLSAVSHDLRTPLAAIKASITSLLDESVEWDEDARREFLTAVNEETDRLTLLVNNLLDLSRIEGGALRPDPSWYDVAELMNDVELRMRSRLGEDAGRLSVQVEPGLPLVYFDYVQIAQVLTNLIENAVVYTPRGTPIRVRVHHRDRFLVFTVVDQGPGIPATEQAHIFERFYRGSQSGSRRSGVGIGLTIAKGLVEANGGRMWVESEEGYGAAFRFELPLHVSNDGQNPLADGQAQPELAPQRP